MRLFGYLNLFLASAILVLILAVFCLPKKTPIETQAVALPKELPKNPFSISEESYLEMCEGPFSLKWISPQMQLPDLRKELVFFGKNGRPDARKNSLLFSLRSSSEFFYAEPGEKIYLSYSGPYARKFSDSYDTPVSGGPYWGEITDKQNKQTYSFCPKGKTSSLWVELNNFENNDTIEVTVHLLDENKTKVIFPEEHRTFFLEAMELPKSQNAGWEVGKYRADTTLLVRQKARWMGPDLFLKMHGGDEFNHTIGKERIEFLDDVSPYSCFVAEGDVLLWKNNKWQVTSGSENTQGLPLLYVKKVEEKVMSFELWDPEGKGKIQLNLIRAKDTSGFPNVSNDFKFVGAKTWAQFIVECRSVRMTLKSHDWLVLTQNGWEKLDSPQTIDDYVEGRIQGPLFVLEKFTKQNGHQALVGHLFNISRTEVENVELVAAQPTSLANFCRTIPKLPPIQQENICVEE